MENSKKGIPSEFSKKELKDITRRIILFINESKKEKVVGKRRLLEVRKDATVLSLYIRSGGPWGMILDVVFVLLKSNNKVYVMELWRARNVMIELIGVENNKICLDYFDGRRYMFALSSKSRLFKRFENYFEERRKLYSKIEKW